MGETALVHVRLVPVGVSRGDETLFRPVDAGAVAMIRSFGGEDDPGAMAADTPRTAASWRALGTRCRIQFLRPV